MRSLYGIKSANAFRFKLIEINYHFDSVDLLFRQLGD